ncbi:MAG: hypothetical protein NTV77_03560 [Candidatus Azambacteria bacterium]|nr:hypothetical protein [Candidatus Azambacteria bacterium]
MRKRKISQSSKLKCAFCQGKGIQPGTGRLSCIVCNGSGRITLKQPHTICKECGGRGKKAGTNLYCLSCQGKGFVEENRYPSIVKSPVSKTRRKKDKKSVRPKAKKEKVIVKKEKKSFLKKLLGTFKIL